MTPLRLACNRGHVVEMTNLLPCARKKESWPILNLLLKHEKIHVTPEDEALARLNNLEIEVGSHGRLEQLRIGEVLQLSFTARITFQ